ncbi:hypothetical protein V3C99_017339 [Haemonchus contortus]
MLIVLLALRLAYAQYTSYNAVAGRLPGRCLPGDFDCGFGRCIPITSFHDGKPDCYDGSDEWCFFGQVKCGAYCVDVSQAFSCLFSSRCDDSNRQPPWCSVSKEKLCGDPSAFPCRGYGECVLWPWLLDGEKHCIDGSDEDQLYVRALEFSFRCYYNRTGNVAMPPPLNYTDGFLKLVNPIPLPGIRPPQFPTLFPPLPTLPSSTLYLTSSPSSFTQPPPVELSKITGLPPLPPPFPSLLPSTPPIIPSTIQSGSNPTVPTEPTVFVPDTIETPDDPFTKIISRPLPQPSTSTQPPPTTIFPDYSTGQGASSSFPSPVNPTTHLPPEVSLAIVSPQTKPHIRGRVTTTFNTPVATTTSSDKLTHIHVGVGGNNPGDNGPISSTSSKGTSEAETSSSSKGTSEPENEKQGVDSTISKLDPKNTESTNDFELLKQTTASPVDASVKGGSPNDNTIPWPDLQGAVNPRFRITTSTQINKIDNDHSDKSETALSSKGVNTAGVTGPNTGTPGAPSHPNPGTSGSSASESGSQSTTMASDSAADANSKTTSANTCLAELIRTSKNRYPSRECQCPTGEMELNERCEASEDNLAFYKLDIHSACGEETLTSEQKKWIAIGKLGETTKIPSCVRMNSNGDVIVNSMCGSACSLSYFQNMMQEEPGSKRSIAVEEAPLCEDPSTNYCHAQAECHVEDVRLTCRCKPGTNDTSDGLGRICEGLIAEDSCIMILGACLIFWLIILLGLLLLIPLILLLLFHCCPRRNNSVHPKKAGVGVKGKKGKKENRHVAAMMSNLLAASAGGQRQMAMKIAMTDLDKKDKKKHHHRSSIKPSTSVEVVDAKDMTSATVINHSSNTTQQAAATNVKPTKEIESIPGTVQSPIGETPILEKAGPPGIAVQLPEARPPEARNILAMKSVSQHSLAVPESVNNTSTTLTPSIISSPPIMQETSSVPASAPTSAVAPPTQPLTFVDSPASHSTASLNPLAPQPPPPPPPPPPPQTFPATVEVHRNNDTTESTVARQSSTHSIGVQPTIWESYKALGDQYAKQEEIDEESCSSSIEALIMSRYAESFANAPIPTAQPSKDKQPSKDQAPSKMKESPKDETPSTVPAVSDEAKEIRSSRPGTRVTTPTEQLQRAILEEDSSTSGDIPLPASVLSGSSTDKAERDAKLADMLGVTQSPPPGPSEPFPTDTGMPKTDEQIVEEISRQGVVLPISPHDIPALSFEDRVTERPKAASAARTRPSKQTSAPRGRPRPTVPNVRVTESERAKFTPQRRAKPTKPTPPSTSAVFVPKKARELQKLKEAVKKPAPIRRSAKAATEARQLLKPPERKKHSSTDESEPEVFPSKRVSESPGRHPSTLARRRQRRPERQLSSISEKSAEIAAEAALQNQPQDYSISAPNTTRSLSEWHQYVQKKTSGEDASDSPTDIDIPSGMRFRLSTSKSRATIDRLKEKRTEPFATWKPPVKAEEPPGPSWKPPVKAAKADEPLRSSWKPPVKAAKADEPLRPSWKPPVKAAKADEHPHPTRKPPVKTDGTSRPRRLCELSSSETSSKTSSTLQQPVRRSRSPLVASPDIPDVTLRRSMDRLDQLKKSPPRGSMTSRSHVRHRASSHKPFRDSAKERITRPKSSKDEFFSSRSVWERLSDPYSIRKPGRRTSTDTDISMSSKNLHRHALISRKIAIRRHETLITKSTSDLTVRPYSSRRLSQTRQASRSADDLHHRPRWDSSPYRPDDNLHSESFLPGIKTTKRPHRKSRSVLTTPRGSVHRSMSKFSLTSLPTRSSSTFELSPYFTPGENSNKPPKESLWWTPEPRSFR